MFDLFDMKAPFVFRAHSSSWTPSMLFASGEQGIFLDPSQTSTMTQDSTGTTPVTDAGQTVGRVLDLSGRGNTALQTTIGSRPTFTIDGNGRARLTFDGTDDWLNAVAVPWGGADEVTIILGVTAALTGITAGVLRGGGNASPTRFGVIKQSNDRMQANSAGTVAITAASAATVTGSPEVYSMTAKISAPSVLLRRNGVQVASSTASQGTGTYVTSDMSIGSWGGGQFFNGSLYSVFAINRRLTAPELAQAESWIAAKSGVTL